MSASLRLPGQACQIPTTRLSILYPTPMGASTMAFSHTGHLLAVGCGDQDNIYPLVIYEVNRGINKISLLVLFVRLFVCQDPLF